MADYLYPFDLGIDAVLALVENNGIPCDHKKAVVTKDTMKRSIRTYETQRNAVLIVPVPEGVNTVNNYAGDNSKRTLKVLMNTEVAVTDIIVFYDVDYEVKRVEVQGKECSKLYQVYLKEV